MLENLWQFVGYVGIVAMVVISLAWYLRKEEIRQEKKE